MPPAEKAKQLVHKFYFSLPNNGGFTGPSNINDRWEEGRMCAMMAVDEILFITDEEEQYILYKYWQEVKTEIENL
jgi:hypothetical protein